MDNEDSVRVPSAAAAPILLLFAGLGARPQPPKVRRRCRSSMRTDGGTWAPGCSNRCLASPRNQENERGKSTLWARPAYQELLELAHITCCLGEQPFAEGNDLGEFGRGLRTDDPIGLGEAQLLGKWAQQSAGN